MPHNPNYLEGFVFFMRRRRETPEEQRNRAERRTRRFAQRAARLMPNQFLPSGEAL